MQQDDTDTLVESHDDIDPKKIVDDEDEVEVVEDLHEEAIVDPLGVPTTSFLADEISDDAPDEEDLEEMKLTEDMLNPYEL